MPSTDDHRSVAPVLSYPRTPDGRYFVMRGRLWRLANPLLDPTQRDELVRALMAARRTLRVVSPDTDRTALRKIVGETKVASGERGPVWWDDGEPDYNRKLVKNTPYAAWYAAVDAEIGSG